MAALDDAWQRLVRLTDQHGDIALAAFLAVGGLGEALREGSESRFPALTLLTTVPLAWRKRWPMVVLGCVFLGAVISREAPYVEVTCAAIAAYSVGAHERYRLLGIAELVIMAFIVVAVFPNGLPPIPQFLGPVLVLLPLWLIGTAIRQGRLRTEAQAERANRLELEKELTEKAARAEERARLARELHDVVAHSVSVMVVQAGAARKVVEQTPDRALDALGAVEDTGREAMKELRQILGLLGDPEPAFDPQPTLGQIGALVQTVREAGLPVEMAMRGDVRPLPPGVESTAYRIVQEALTNALKHSGMAPTQVVIDYRPKELKVEVLSDGDAPTNPTNQSGRGLAGMKERIAVLGGRLEAGPGIERGYAVRAWLPLEPAGS